MKTLSEQQVKGEELIDIVTRIPLTQGQLTIINEINKDKLQNQKEKDQITKREQDIITFTVEFQGINQADLKSIVVEDSSLVITTKGEKKLTKVEEISKETIEELTSKTLIEEKPQEVVPTNHK